MANWLSKFMEYLSGPSEETLRAKSVALSETAALLCLDTAEVKRLGAQRKLELIKLYGGRVYDEDGEYGETRVTKSSLKSYYHANRETINRRKSEAEQKRKRAEAVAEQYRQAKAMWEREQTEGLLPRIFVHPEIGDAQLDPSEREDALKGVLRRNPQDAQAHLELGVCLVIKSANYGWLLPEMHNDVWRHKGTRYGGMRPLGSRISGEFLSSMSLGLDMAFLSGIAHFYYGVAAGDRTIEDTAMKESVRQFRRWLRSNPHDLDALHFLVVAYTRLGRNADAEKTRLAIAKAEQLQRLGALQTQKKSIKEQAPSTQAKGIAFEELCQSLVRAMGFSTTTTSVTADGGIDIVATSTQPLFSGKYIIQCKDWSNTVGEPVVRDLYGVVHAENANKGILIATSKFTKAAQRFAEGKPLELIDGELFSDLLKQYKIQDKE